jgi:hypothetical protein
MGGGGGVNVDAYGMEGIADDDDIIYYDENDNIVQYDNPIPDYDDPAD